MTETWARYNCIDAATTFKIWNDIQPDIEAQGHENLYRDTMSLYPPVIFMQTVGLLVDKEALKNEKQKAAKQAKHLENKLNEVCGFELNVNSPKQCRDYFYNTLGHNPYRGAKGSITTDDKAMARLFRKGVKEAKLVQEIRGLNKLVGTYLDVATDPDGRIRASFNLRGTVTGRLSSGQNIFGTGLGFQNLDAAFKSFIKADKDRFFISLDKAKAEWVIVAYVSRDPRMIEAIESGENVHITTAHMITGVPKHLIEKEYELLSKTTDQDHLQEVREAQIPEIFKLNKFLPRNMTCYQAGKRTNHGCNYVMTYRRFALENEIPEAESKLMVNGYQDTYLNLLVWWDRVKDKLGTDRTLENCFGHKRRFRDAWGPDLFKAGVAYIPQSTSVWILNYAMRDCYRDNRSYMDSLWLHAQVHDELLLSYPIGDWLSAARAIIATNQHMSPIIEYEGTKFGIDTELAIGLNWGDHAEDNTLGMRKIKLTSNERKLSQILEAEYGAITK